MAYTAVLDLRWVCHFKAHSRSLPGRTLPTHPTVIFTSMRSQARCSVLLATAAASVAIVAAATNVSVDVPAQAPSKSVPLASTLLSFSLEQDRWPDWAEIDERNEFTYSALKTYADLTGQPPKIRVGGDSEDNTAWSPTVTVRGRAFQRY